MIRTKYTLYLFIIYIILLSIDYYNVCYNDILVNDNPSELIPDKQEQVTLRELLENFFLDLVAWIIIVVFGLDVGNWWNDDDDDE